MFKKPDKLQQIKSLNFRRHDEIIKLFSFKKNKK